MSQSQRTASIEAVALRWAVQAPRVTPGSKKLDHLGFQVIISEAALEQEAEVLALLTRVARDYQSAGYPLKKRVNVLVQGVKGTNRSRFYGDGYNLIQLLPKTLSKEPDYYHTVVHELAHWYHFNQVAGGFHNPEIVTKFSESVRAALKVDSTTVGTPLDRVKALHARLEQRKDKLLVASNPKRGDVISVPGKLNPFVGNEPYTRQYKVLKAPGKKTTMTELLNPSPWDLQVWTQAGRKPPVLREEVTHSLRHHHMTPEIRAELKELDVEIAKVTQEWRDLVKGLGTSRFEETRYEDQVTDWVPTTYAKENHKEWFAEVMTAAILKPGSMKPHVLEWLKTVA